MGVGDARVLRDNLGVKSGKSSESCDGTRFKLDKFDLLYMNVYLGNFDGSFLTDGLLEGRDLVDTILPLVDLALCSHVSPESVTIRSRQDRRPGLESFDSSFWSNELNLDISFWSIGVTMLDMLDMSYSC